MKSKLFFFILTLLTATVFGQEMTRADIVKHKIKSVTTIDGEKKVKLITFYNDSGYILKSGSLGDAGNFLLSREFIYSQAGQLAEERTYVANGLVNSIEKYFYNVQSQLIKKEHSDANGNFKSVWDYEYDNKGNKIKEVQTSSTIGNSLTLYKYENNSLLIEEEKSNNSIGKEEKVWYSYDDKGKLIQKKTKDYFGGGIITQTYVYNEIGKLVKLTEKSSNGVASIAVYNYAPDGLLLSDTWQGSFSKTAYKTTYKITTE